MTHPGGGSGGSGPSGPAGPGPGRPMDVPAGRVTRTVPARPRASLDVALQLVQAGVLALALSVLIGNTPAPEPTTYSPPATQEEIQRHTDARLDWQLHHPQP